MFSLLIFKKNQQQEQNKYKKIQIKLALTL